jgi:shikimate kinase
MPIAVLIGPPGSGKSSIGRAIGKLADTTFLDTDALIEELTHKSIKEIFEQQGEPAFREIEEEVVLGVLRSEPGVVALGGGSILSSKVFDLLLDATFPVIYLSVSPAQGVARVSKNDTRPLLAKDPEISWQELVSKRTSLYEQLARITVSTDSKKANEIATELALLLGIGGEK